MSQPEDGSDANRPSEGEVSGNATEVFLTSSASNLVAGDTNGVTDVFAKSLSTGAVTRLSVASGGVQANGASTYLSASSDGTKVLFRSLATNLVTKDTNGLEDFFLLNRMTGAITRVNVLSNGGQITKSDQNWQEVSLSPDGLKLAYVQPGNRGGVFVEFLSTGVRSAVDKLPSGATMYGVGLWHGITGPAHLSSSTVFSGDSRYMFVMGRESADWPSRVDTFRWDIASGTSAPVSSDMTNPINDPYVGHLDFRYVSSSSDGRFATVFCSDCERAYGMPWDACVVGNVPGSVGSCPGTMWVKDMSTGKTIRLPRELLGPPEPYAPEYGNEIRDAQLSPDGRLALVMTTDYHDNQSWAVYDVVTGAIAPVFGPDPQVYGVRWSAGGAGFSFVSAPGNLSPENAPTASNVFYMGAMAAPDSAFGVDDYGGTMGNYTRTDGDASVAGYGPELNVVRTYNSLDKRTPGGFGAGWSWNYDMRLTIDTNGDAFISYPDGRVERHTKSGGTFTAPKGYGSSLQAAGSGYELTQRDGTVYRFGSAGRLTSIFNANGQALTFTYDGSGNLSRATAASGRYLDFTWNGNGRITQVSSSPINGNPLIWKYYYNNGRLTDACDPRDNTSAGACRRYTYGGGFKGDRLTKVANPDGSTIDEISYRASDERMASHTDGTGATWSYEYPDPRRSVETDPRGNRTRTSYDADWRVTKVADADGFVTYGYDDHGFRNEVKDANGNVVTTTYNARGDVRSTTDGAGNTAYFSYNTAGLVTQSRSRRSSSATDDRFLTTYDYDAAGNKIRETLPPTADVPVGATRRWVYTTGSEPAVGGGVTPAGLVKSEFDARNHATTYEYDAKGDLRVVTDRAGRRTEYTYDALGRKTAASEITTEFPSGLPTTFDYNAVGDVTEAVAPPVTDTVTGEHHQVRTVRTFNLKRQLTSEARSDVLGGDPSRTTEYGYDGAGRLDLVRDALQGELRRTYDGAGNIHRVTDQAGQVYEMTYDERNRPTKIVALAVTNPVTGTSEDVTLSERSYDPGGRLTATLDSLGHTRTFDYDGADRLTKVTLLGFTNRDATARDVVVEQYEYDKDGNITAEVTGNGKRREERTWTEDGRTKTTTVGPSTLNRRTTFTYDPDGSVLREVLTDAAGSEETRNTYDAADRVTATTVENGANDLTTSFGYDQRGNLTSRTDPRGAAGATAYTTDFAYDEAGNLIVERAPPTELTDANGTGTARPTTSYGYNAYGDATTVKTPTGEVTTTTFDKLGRARTIQYPDYTRPDGVAQPAATESMSYSATGNLSGWTDRRGGTWDFTFDSLNRPVQTQQPLVDGARPTTVTSYDKASHPIKVVDAENAIHQATYDDLGRQRTATVVVGTGVAARPLTTVYDYDDLGNRIYVEDQLGHATKAAFNAESEQVSSTDGLQHTAEFGRDLRGRLTTTTDAVGQATRESYDLAGRQTGHQVLNLDGTVAATWTYGFDAASNRTQARSPEGRVTDYGYNAVNWLTQVVQHPGAAAVATSYGYDANGAPTAARDGRGNTTMVSYNSWGLPESTVEPATTQHPVAVDRTWTRSYDPAGALAVEEQPGGIDVAYSYDALGRLSGEQGSGALPAATRTFGYDRLGRLTGFSRPDGQQQLSYDERGQLTGSNGPGGAATLTYDDAGRLTSQQDANGTTSFGWNSADLLASVDDPLTGLTTTYGYDNAQKPTTEVTKAGSATINTRSYAYDTRGRLASDELSDSAAVTLTSQGYGYDDDGLLTSYTSQLPGNTESGSQAFGYDGASRLKSWTSAAGFVRDYAYDDAGNLTAAGTDTFTYDERNRLVHGPEGDRSYDARGDLTSEPLAGGSTRTYEYDSLGKLASVSTGADATGYAYDALGRLVTRDSATFGYVGTATDPIRIGSQGYTRTPAGRLVGATDGAAAYQVGSNRRGDLTQLIATDGTVVGTAAYDPLGIVADTTGASTSLGWQGDYTDPATGLVDMGARWYQPETGGFITRDTYAGTPTRPVSLNRYTYANGNPLEFTDPTGYCGWSLSGLVDCVTDAGHAVVSTVSTGARYVVTGITTGIGYARSAATWAWNAGTEALKSFAATAYRGITQGAAATFTAGVNYAAVQRKIGTYTAATLLNFGSAAVGKAKTCLTTSGTCRTVVTAVAVATVAIACTACLVPMAIGGGLGAAASALTCPADQDRAMCALKGGLTGALAGAAGVGAAGALGRTALAGSRLAQIVTGGAAAGFADESTRQFIDGELNPTRIVAATVAGAGLGAGTHGTLRAASKLASLARASDPSSSLANLRGSIAGRAAARNEYGSIQLPLGASKVPASPYGFRGGRYGELATGNGIEVHHMPADSVTSLSRARGPAIQMERLDHYQTASWGRSNAAQAYRAEQKALVDAGRFDDAIQMDIDDVISKFPGKYDDAILEMIDRL